MSLTNRRPEVAPTADDLARKLGYAVFPKAHIQRGERTWLVRIYVGREQGKRKYDNHTVHGTKKDAQAYLNGKLRERISVPAGITEAKATELATAQEKVKPHIVGKQLVKVVYVPGRLVNIVVK